jgi:hypothetical protein
MYLPPNNDGAASFLETLRLMLVHETRDRDGLPRGLELGFGTARGWLEPGKSIAVRDAPTSFGLLSYTIHRDTTTVEADVELPSSPALSTVRLRLRVPADERIAGVELGGRRLPFDARSDTVDLSGRSGDLQLVATIAAT